MNKAKVSTVMDIVNSTNGKFFSVTFIKADGTQRKMTCHTKVQKHLKGGVKTYDKKDVLDGDATIGVYEEHSKGYRCFKASKVLQLKFAGNVVNFS